jgi:hypothetical protein
MMTQVEKLRGYLEANPGASSLEITKATEVVNVTGRVSDLRARGVDIRCRKRRDGRDGYWIVKHPVQLTLTGAEEAIA